MVMIRWLVSFLRSRKIATSRISPAWRSHSRRVLISVHSEQLCLVDCLSSVLVSPCIHTADARCSSAWLDRWLSSCTFTGPCRSRYPSVPVTLFPSILQKLRFPNRSIILSIHLGSKILDLSSSRIPPTNTTETRDVSRLAYEVNVVTIMYLLNRHECLGMYLFAD